MNGRRLLILNERDIHHPAAGGAELHILEMAKQFVAAGYRPLLLCTSFPGAAGEEVQDGLAVQRFGNRFTYYLKLPARVRRALRDDPGAVIIEHLNKLPFCTPWYTRAPVVLVVHHLFGATAFQQVAAPIAAVVYAAERLIPLTYGGCPFVAVSPSTRLDLIERGVPAASIVVVPNGLDHDRYHENGVEGAVEPTLLVLGRVEHYKRVDLVLEAAQRLLHRWPALIVSIVGDGSARPLLEQKARRLGLAEHVVFRGFVSEADKVAAIRRSQVVVNVSEKEGWGLTVLEANACGVPAVASDVPGLRDSVRHGVTGLLVPFGDVSALVAALEELLGNRERRRQLGRAAVEWAARFSWQQSARDVLAVVEAAAAGAPSIAELATTLSSHRALTSEQG